MRPLVATLATFVLVGALSSSATAQETRAEEQRREQASKAAALSPSTKNAAERIVDWLRAWGIFEDEPAGFYPYVGRVYTSGGPAVGGGYRRPFHDTGALTARAAVSARSFTFAELKVELPRWRRDRVAIEAALNWLDAPSVPFYGSGPDSQKTAETTFGYQPTSVGATLRYEPIGALSVGGGVDYVRVGVTPGSSATAGPLPASAASMTDADQRYLRGRAFVAFDWRADEGFTGRGGRYQVGLDHYAAAGEGTSLRRLESDLVQLVPILRGNWVIALRGLTTLTYTREGDAAPFYLMPTLGGSDLRGFSTMRFRGPQRVLGSAELRWTPARVLDMALFYDAGRVADRPRDLTRGRFERSYGIGARIHGQGASAMRVDLAHSREHAVRVALSFGVVF